LSKEPKVYYHFLCVKRLFYSLTVSLILVLINWSL